MPQMMPINWLIIFFMCLLCLLTLIILISSMVFFLKIKDKSNKFLFKKWMWFW